MQSYSLWIPLVNMGAAQSSFLGMNQFWNSDLKLVFKIMCLTRADRQFCLFCPPPKKSNSQPKTTHYSLLHKMTDLSSTTPLLFSATQRQIHHVFIQTSLRSGLIYAVHTCLDLSRFWPSPALVALSADIVHPVWFIYMQQCAGCTVSVLTTLAIVCACERNGMSLGYKQTKPARVKLNQDTKRRGWCTGFQCGFYSNLIDRGADHKQLPRPQAWSPCLETRCHTSGRELLALRLLPPPPYKPHQSPWTHL